MSDLVINASVDWREVAALLEELYTSSARLEAIFPHRKFTLDGHLVGSIGEVVAAYMFDLELNAASTAGHDAIAPDCRRVEIKLTQGTAVAFRECPDHAIVLHRSRIGPVSVIYNGPGALLWGLVGGLQKNGTYTLRLSRLASLGKAVPAEMQLPQVRPAPV